MMAVCDENVCVAEEAGSVDRSGDGELLNRSVPLNQDRLVRVSRHNQLAMLLRGRLQGQYRLVVVLKDGLQVGNVVQRQAVDGSIC